jgi:hypothetical protein
MTQTIKALLVMLCLASLTGCQSMRHVMQEKDTGGGTTRVYPVSVDQAWELSKTVFRWSGTDAIEEHRNQGYMLTSSGMNLVTAGAVMGAWMEPAGRGQTKVTVVTKRRIATNLATTLTEGTFHRHFAQAVEIVKAGKSLPAAPPN